MDELLAQVREWRDALRRGRERVVGGLPWWWQRALVAVLIVIGILLPFAFTQTSGFLDATIRALAFVVMALGLNIVVGFAGLLDLGYVAFYALGAYCVGWFGSGFFFNAHVHVLVSSTAAAQPGIHLNFLLIAVAAVVICAVAGTLIGLPT